MTFQRKRARSYRACPCGEAGIRTLDTLLGYTHFPGARLRPLGHLSRPMHRKNYERKASNKHHGGSCSAKVILSSEIIEVNHVVLNAQVVEHLARREGHHRRSTKVILYIFGTLMVLEVLIEYHLMDITHGARPII